MKKIAYISVFIFSVGLLSTCDCERIGLCKDNELELVKVDYNGNQLETDGYFFGDIGPDSDTLYANIFYLYRNGVFFTSEAEDLDKAEEGTINVDIENTFGKEIKGLWGLFQVNGNLIEIERWLTSINGCETTIYERGDIVNDTTFVITRREYRDNGKVQGVETPNGTFYFRPLTQKPDSTNIFIP